MSIQFEQLSEGNSRVFDSLIIIFFGGGGRSFLSFLKKGKRGREMVRAIKTTYAAFSFVMVPMKPWALERESPTVSLFSA